VKRRTNARLELEKSKGRTYLEGQAYVKIYLNETRWEDEF
jgi:hypothetical protein